MYYKMSDSVCRQRRGKNYLIDIHQIRYKHKPTNKAGMNNVHEQVAHITVSTCTCVVIVAPISHALHESSKYLYVSS